MSTCLRVTYADGSEAEVGLKMGSNVIGKVRSTPMLSSRGGAKQRADAHGKCAWRARFPAPVLMPGRPGSLQMKGWRSGRHRAAISVLVTKARHDHHRQQT
jgi:hypothetical protein